MIEYKMYINGKWTESKSKEKFTTKNPTTGEILATFPKGTKEDMVKAIEAAEGAFVKWKKVPAPKRGEILLKASSILRDRKEELGQILTKEMGKVIAEGRGEVQEAIDFIAYVAGEGRRLFGETTPSELPNKFCMTVRQPIGVVGCITPWNFPIAIPCWKLGAALISGNSVIFKPASLTPWCAAKLVEVFEEAGLPPGVLSLVTGSGSVIGNEMVENPRVKVISFTGGVSTGIDIYSRASKLLKPVHLEMGGKNPQIIMDDADIDLAVEGVLFGAFGSAGQKCTATSRLLIQEGVYDLAVEKLLARTKAMKIGDPLDPQTDIGPVADGNQEKKILEYIQIGKEEGARLLCGGNKVKENFIEPTIFEAQHGMRITKEEIFGPVLSIMKIKDYEEAVRVANDVEYGLSSSIYTRDVNLAFRAIDDLEVGITFINAPTTRAEKQLPFGGIKNTGNGGRETGTAAIDEFTEIKTVFIDYSGALQKAQIEEKK